MYRTPEQRAKLWDRKMNAEVYAVYLGRTKPIALDKIIQYQAIHEELIKIVKSVISKYPDELIREHAYVWFAQGIWYCKMRYRDEALQREANALFIYWLALGLREEPLREIAQQLGVTIDPTERILAKQLGILVSEQVYEGTRKAIEETLMPLLEDPDVKTNPLKIDIEYDENKNIKKMTITDKLTGETRTITFMYDPEGYLISIDET